MDESLALCVLQMKSLTYGMLMKHMFVCVGVAAVIESRLITLYSFKTKYGQTRSPESN